MLSNIQILGIAVALFVSLPTFATTGSGTSEPFSFKTWKKHQVVQAKNEVVRLNNKIHLIKTGRYKMQPSQISEVTTATASGGEQAYAKRTLSVDDKKERESIKAAEQKVLKQSEQKLKMAKGNLRYAKELSIDDYLAVYLGRFRSDPAALAKAAEKLSKEEISALLSSFLKNSETRIPPESPSAPLGGDTASAGNP